MPSEYAKTLGARLRAIRTQQGLSLHGVEEKSRGRWKAVVVGSYERGDRSVTVQKLAELAEFYGVPVSELLPGDVLPALLAPSPKLVIDLERMSQLPKDKARPPCRRPRPTRPAGAAAAAGRAPRGCSRRAIGTSPHRAAARRPRGARQHTAIRPQPRPACSRRRRKTRPTRTAQAQPAAAVPRRSGAASAVPTWSAPPGPRRPPRPPGAPPDERRRNGRLPTLLPRHPLALAWPTPAAQAPTAPPCIVAGQDAPARPSSCLPPIACEPGPGEALPHTPRPTGPPAGPREARAAGWLRSDIFEHKFVSPSSCLDLRSKLQGGSDKTTARRPCRVTYAVRRAQRDRAKADRPGGLPGRAGCAHRHLRPGHAAAAGAAGRAPLDHGAARRPGCLP